MLVWEIFQHKLYETQCLNIYGVFAVAVIHRDRSEDLDQHLIGLLNRCREKNIKLNKKKFEYAQTEILFIGHKVTRDGLQTDPLKVKAILDMKMPQNISEMRRLFEIVNYLGNFLPNITDVTELLQNLVKKYIAFIITPMHENVFQRIQQMITKASILK